MMPNDWPQDRNDLSTECLDDASWRSFTGLDREMETAYAIRRRVCLALSSSWMALDLAPDWTGELALVPEQDRQQVLDDARRGHLLWFACQLPGDARHWLTQFPVEGQASQGSWKLAHASWWIKAVSHKLILRAREALWQDPANLFD